MEFFTDILRYEFNQRALLGAIMIGFINGYFGSLITIRKSSLYAGALSHTLFPGIAVGALIAGLNPLSAFIGATLTALIVGIISQSVSIHSRMDQNAALAVLYTTAFAIGLFILKKIGLYIQIENYLFGNILAISNFDLYFIFFTGLLIISTLVLFQRSFLMFIFSADVARSHGISVSLYEYIFATMLVLTMITSFQAVGTILSLGLLVAPSSIMYLISDNPKKIMWYSGFLGMGISALSVFLSNWFNLETGSLIIIILGILFLMTFLLSPSYGLIRYLYKKH